MKTFPLFLCSLSTLCTAHAKSPAPPGDSPALTLDAITEAVRASNPGLRAAHAKWEALEQHVPQAAAWEDPRISGTTRLARFVDVARNSFTDQMVSAEQSIPISGKNLSRARIAAAEARSALEEWRRLELDTVSQARGAWFRLAREWTLIDLNRASEASLLQSEEIGRARMKVATEGQGDVLAAEGERARIAETRTDLEQAVAEDETRLNVLMNRDAFSKLARPSPAKARPALPSTELLRGLLPSRPELRMAEAGLLAAKARLELARREWVPDPTVSLEAQRYNSSQAVSEIAAGVSFNVPWLNRTKYRAEEREAESGVEAAQAAAVQARTQALGLLREQWQKAESAHHHLQSHEAELIPLARQMVQANRAGYESGKTGFLELVASERALRDTEAMYQQQLADYRIALAELASIVGADFGPFAAENKGPVRKAR